MIRQYYFPPFREYKGKSTYFTNIDFPSLLGNIQGKGTMHYGYCFSILLGRVREGLLGWVY